MKVVGGEGGDRRWRRWSEEVLAGAGAGAFAGVDAGEMVGPSGRENQCKTI